MKKYVHVISVFVDFAAQVFQIPQVTPKVKNVLIKKIFKSYHIFNLWGTEDSEIALIMMTSHWRVFFVNREVINFVAKHALMVTAYTSGHLKLYAHVSNKWWMLSFVQICNVVVVPSVFFSKQLQAICLYYLTMLKCRFQIMFSSDNCTSHYFQYPCVLHG